MKIRFLSFILALLLLCAPLCACNTPANEPEATTPADTTKDPAITTEDPDVTPPDNTEPSDLIAPITPENANGLYIICKENASSVIKNSLKQLAQSIARKFGCNEPTVINGDAPERDGVLEIVVGSPLEGALPLR